MSEYVSYSVIYLLAYKTSDVTVLPPASVLKSYPLLPGRLDFSSSTPKHPCALNPEPLHPKP